VFLLNVHDFYGFQSWQILNYDVDGKQRSCNAAVTHATRYRLEHGLEPPGADSGDYCRARRKLNTSVVKQIASHIAQTLSHASPDHWLWLGASPSNNILFVLRANIKRFNAPIAVLLEPIGIFLHNRYFSLFHARKHGQETILIFPRRGVL
jgi:hypothetical protein